MTAPRAMLLLLALLLAAVARAQDGDPTPVAAPASDGVPDAAPVATPGEGGEQVPAATPVDAADPASTPGPAETSTPAGDGLRDDDPTPPPPTPTPVPLDPDAAPPTVDTRGYPDRLSGEWYVPALSCPFCANLIGQTVQAGKQETVIKYYDHVDLDPATESGKLILRAEKELIPLRVSWKDGVLMVVYFDQGDLPRASESFARVWLLTPTANDHLLYGRVYTFYVFNDEAFTEDEAAGRWTARPEFFGIDRITALLTDERVATLHEDRRLYVPSTEVRVAYEGAHALFRMELTEADLAAGREQALAEVRGRAERVSVFRTLVAAGDQLYSRGEYERAMAQYIAAGSVRPGESVVYANLGAAYQMLRRYAEADQAYRFAADLAPGDMLITYNRAIIAEAQREWILARDLYREVLKADPKDPEAAERLTIVEPLARQMELR